MSKQNIEEMLLKRLITHIKRIAAQNSHIWGKLKEKSTNFLLMFLLLRKFILPPYNSISFFIQTGYFWKHSNSTKRHFHKSYFLKISKHCTESCHIVSSWGSKWHPSPHLYNIVPSIHLNKYKIEANA